QLQARQERVFQNRFGDLICEDILHLTLRPQGNGDHTPPREIAREVLTSAFCRAPAESVPDLKSALEKLGEVEPSPMYHRGAALSCRPIHKIKEAV
ncbi:MAG TPA: hypothetical protein VKA46_23695, partial [Gemmataceae bacterium]|nr:hypothetical protein [Gemmataceae bacterium]